MRIILIASISILISACASNQNIVKNASDSAEVASKVYEVKSEFGEHRIYGPGIVKDFGGVLHNDKLTVQLMKTESDKYYLRVHNFHSGNGWKFIESITTLEKETIKLQEVSRETGVCLSSGCSFTEIGFAPLDFFKYLSGNNQLKVRVNAQRWGTKIVVLPKEYIQAFIKAATQQSTKEKS